MPVATALPRPNDLARLIHDDILQMLGVCLLGAELCRRFWRNDRQDQVIVELEGVLDGLTAVARSTRCLLDDVDLAAVWEQAMAPSRLALETTLASHLSTRGLITQADRELDGQPGREVLQALEVCLLQGELCRRLHTLGQEQPALMELSIMLQRLEQVVGTFRVLMDRLRTADEASYGPLSGGARPNPWEGSRRPALAS